MALTNLIAQLESGKYSALSEGITQAANAIASAQDKKRERTLMDLQLDKARRESEINAQRTSILKTDASDMDKVVALNTVGDIEGARQLHSHSLLMKKEQTEAQYSALRTSEMQAEWLGREASALEQATPEQQGAVLQNIAQRFTESMTTDPNNPVSINQAIPDGMTDPGEIAKFWKSTSGKIQEGIDKKYEGLAANSGDEYIKMAITLKRAEDMGADSFIIDSIRETMAAHQNNRRIAETDKAMASSIREFKWDKEFSDETILSLAEKMGFDPNKVPQGIEKAVKYAWDNRNTRPLSELTTEIANTWGIEKRPAERVGTFGAKWNETVPSWFPTIEDPTLIPPTSAAQSVLPTGSDAAVRELQSLQDFMKKF